MCSSDLLVCRAPAGTRIVLTADHGMVDTDEDRRVDVTAHPDLARDVVAVAGEPRFTQLYVPGSDPEVAARVAGRWRDLMGERAAWVGTRKRILMFSCLAMSVSNLYAQSYT